MLLLFVIRIILVDVAKKSHQIYVRFERAVLHIERVYHVISAVNEILLPVPVGLAVVAWTEGAVGCGRMKKLLFVQGL